jgi:hypothetical protein
LSYFTPHRASASSLDPDKQQFYTRLSTTDPRRHRSSDYEHIIKFRQSFGTSTDYLMYDQRAK